MAKSRKGKESAGGAEFAVEWGYEDHSLKVSSANWARIQAGKRLSLKGRRYSYEGEDFACEWHFNHGEPGSLLVSYCSVGGDSSDEGEGFDGTWEEALV